MFAVQIVTEHPTDYSIVGCLNAATLIFLGQVVPPAFLEVHLGQGDKLKCIILIQR